jgi:hypothetical protein
MWDWSIYIHSFCKGWEQMPVVVSDSGGGSFEHPPAGMHQAVCAKVFDLGEQPGFQGKPQHKVAIVWQLAEARKEGKFAGEPFTVTKTYTASLNEKSNLRKDLEGWRGRGFTPQELAGFDLENVVGVNCTLNLVSYTTKAGNESVRISGIMPVQKGVELLAPTLPADYMPKWIREALGQTEDEPREHVEDDFMNDIPF